MKKLKKILLALTLMVISSNFVLAKEWNVLVNKEGDNVYKNYHYEGAINKIKTKHCNQDTRYKKATLFIGNDSKKSIMKFNDGIKCDVEYVEYKYRINVTGGSHSIYYDHVGKNRFRDNYSGRLLITKHCHHESWKEDVDFFTSTRSKKIVFRNNRSCIVKRVELQKD